MIRALQLAGALQDRAARLEAQTEELHRLNERLLRVQEEERAGLAADLHDEALQTAVRLHRALMADGRGRAATAGHAALSERIIDQLRAVCLTLRPAMLDELGPAAALEALVQDLGERETIPILLDADPEAAELVLTRDAELALYRAAQEALANALGHARATAIHLTVQREAATLRLHIADDGVGFAVPESLEDLAAAGHLGLAGLHHRVRRAGGCLAIASTPGRGTTVTVAFTAALKRGGRP